MIIYFIGLDISGGVVMDHKLDQKKVIALWLTVFSGSIQCSIINHSVAQGKFKCRDVHQPGDHRGHFHHLFPDPKKAFFHCVLPGDCGRVFPDGNYAKLIPRRDQFCFIHHGVGYRRRLRDFIAAVPFGSAGASSSAPSSGLPQAVSTIWGLPRGPGPITRPIK